MSNDSIRDYDDDEFVIDEQGDQIDRAMETKAEQEMLADDEHDVWVDNPVLAGMRQWGITPENALATLNHESVTYDHILDWCESWEWASPDQIEEARQVLYDDPEADAADAADREADEMFAAYQADRRRTRLVEEVDQSLAYEKNDPKRETALGWEG